MKKSNWRGRIIGGLVLLLLGICLPAMAQLAPSEPDPLARIRDAAKNNAQACSATGETLCEQVAPKIVANAEGDSPLEVNLVRLALAVHNDISVTLEEPAAIAWAVSSFRDAKVDVHTEKYLPPSTASGPARQEVEDVVAEIRGRERPDEWVLLGAQLWAPVSMEDAASVIEAARDIQLTGIRPRRSIRFVLFASGETGSLPYVQAHRSELDRASAVIILSAGAAPVDGFALSGRHDVEAGVKAALDPIPAMGVTHFTFDAPLDLRGLFFLLEGVPTLLTSSSDAGRKQTSYASVPTVDAQELKGLKRNTAIAAVMAFDVAERVEPLGPRQSRAEVEPLLKATGLDKSMKAQHLWGFWESEQSGRLP
jgi:hypothetical protein